MSFHGSRRQRGFTMIELMIATFIFSVILVVITAGVMRFTRQYYKGIISNMTQNTARSIIDEVSRAVQYNSSGIAKLTTNNPSTPPDHTKPAVGYCVGESRRYSFALNRQVKDVPNPSDSQSKFALVSDSTGGCTASSLAIDTGTLNDIHQMNDGTPLVNSKEMLGQHMRLNKFSIDKLPGPDNLYKITVKVVYGENDLLCSPSAANCDAPAAPGSWLQNDDIRCRLADGSHFCALAELSTTVQKRVN